MAFGAQLVQLASAAGRPDAALWGHLWRVDAEFQLGAVSDLLAELLDLASLVERIGWALGAGILTAACDSCRADRSVRRGSTLCPGVSQSSGADPRQGGPRPVRPGPHRTALTDRTIRRACRRRRRRGRTRVRSQCRSRRHIRLARTTSGQRRRGAGDVRANSFDTPSQAPKPGRGVYLLPVCSLDDHDAITDPAIMTSARGRCSGSAAAVRCVGRRPGQPEKLSSLALSAAESAS